MKQYSFVCSLGHTPETMIVEALNDDEALEKMLILVQEHIAKNHPDMPQMSEEQKMSMLKTTWTKH